LEYYSNYYGTTPDASDKVVIKVVSGDISISRVGDDKDFFVELSNNTDYDADISKWILTSNTKSFVLPKNTVMQTEKKLILSPRVTNFSIIDKNSLRLMDAQGGVVFDYVSSITPPVPVQNTISTKQSSSHNSKVAVATIVADKIPELSPVTNLSLSPESLEASAINTSVITEASNKNSYFPLIAFVLFLGAGAGAVYFIRQRRVVMNVGDDFKILDE